MDDLRSVFPRLVLPAPITNKHADYFKIFMGLCRPPVGIELRADTRGQDCRQLEAALLLSSKRGRLQDGSSKNACFADGIMVFPLGEASSRCCVDSLRLLARPCFPTAPCTRMYNLCLMPQKATKVCQVSSPQMNVRMLINCD